MILSTRREAEAWWWALDTNWELNEIPASFLHSTLCSLFYSQSFLRGHLVPGPKQASGGTEPREVPFVLKGLAP